ncbi:hypothetical protein PCLA_09r0131 [Pseudomonas citronellolis]|nr:hypothetical protein PCLA_09r0131 [Pseudomonas citronellolis]
MMWADRLPIPLAIPGRVFVDEVLNPLCSYPCLGQGRDQLEDMGKPLPYLQLHGHAGCIGLCRGAHGVIQKHFRAAHLEQHRGEAGEISEQGGYRRLRIGMGRRVEVADGNGEGQREDRVMRSVDQAALATEGQVQEGREQNRATRQGLLAGLEVLQRGHYQIATGGVAGDDDVPGLESLVQQPLVGRKALIQRSGVWMFRGQAIIHHQRAGFQAPTPGRHHGGVHIGRVGHEGPSVDIKQHPIRPVAFRR